MMVAAAGGVSDLQGWSVLWCGVAVAVLGATVGLVTAKLLRWGLRRSGMEHPPLPPHRSPTVAVFTLATLMLFNRGLDRPWADSVATLLGLGLTAAVAWFFIDLVTVAEAGLLARYPEDLEDLRSRHIRTQVTLLRRISVALIVTIAVASMLWSFPAVRQLGLSIFASAGVLGIVAGLAAQTTLGNVFAGTQIAFTDAIRVGDVVVIGDEWGHIETITLTYVAVRIWDGTTLILPCTYFTTTPFKNWTHAGADVIGQLDLVVNWGTDIDRMRAELDRIVATSPLWDGSVARLVVETTTETHLALRVFVSADRSDSVADLLRHVREGLVTYMQRHDLTIPVSRVELTGAAASSHQRSGAAT